MLEYKLSHHTMEKEQLWTFPSWKLLGGLLRPGYAVKQAQHSINLVSAKPAAKGEWDLDVSHLPQRQPAPGPGIPSWQSGQTPQASTPCGRQTDGRCSSSDFKPFLSQDVLFGVQSNYQTQKIINHWLYVQVNNPILDVMHRSNQRSSYPAVGYLELQGKGEVGKTSIILPLAGKLKAQRHRGACRRGRLAGAWLQVPSLSLFPFWTSFSRSKDTQRKTR